MRSLLLLAGLIAVILSCANCQKECPANEEYLSCGPSCQTECATLNQPCLIQHFRCPDGCYCNKGYARRTSDGACISISDC